MLLITPRAGEGCRAPWDHIFSPVCSTNLYSWATSVNKPAASPGAAMTQRTTPNAVHVDTMGLTAAPCCPGRVA